MGAPYAVWTLRPNPKDEAKPFWHRIGSGFLHKNKGGINVVLDALPIDGRLVIMPAKKKGETEGKGGGDGKA